MIEIKYWLNNVYAHSSAEQRTIFLVGMHSASSLNGSSWVLMILKECTKLWRPLVYKCHDRNPESCFFPDLLPILGLLPLTQQPLQFLLLILVSV